MYSLRRAARAVLLLTFGCGLLPLSTDAQLALPDGQSHLVGSFGGISAREIFLEPGDSAIDRILESSETGLEVRWLFSKNPEEVKLLLLNCGVESSKVEYLTDPGRVEIGADKETILRPDTETIFGLSGETRSQLYPHIGPSVTANPYFNPYSIWEGGFSQMTCQNLGLSEERVDDISRLVFKLPGGKLQFSDIQLVLSRTESDLERKGILKALRRKLSLQALLDLSNLSPVQRDALIQYWDGGGKNPGGAEFLRAVLDSGSLQQVGLNRLLPPRCRELLHTYPSVESSRGKSWPDCFSTAYSFFAKEFGYRYFDREPNVVMDRYDEVSYPLSFGDIVLFENEAGKAIHACNHIAGDIVFTKNGLSPTNPWVFQHLKDVLYLYNEREEISISYLRLKPPFRQ